MNIALYCIAGWLVLGALLAVGSIGRQRKPMTPGAAVIVVLIDAGLAVLLVLAAGRLA